MNRFSNKIYATKQVTEELPPEIIMLIVSLVKTLHKEIEEVDYLQIFKIRNNILIHKQEILEYRKAYILSTKIHRCKLFCIDSEEYSTLMFSWEY